MSNLIYKWGVQPFWLWAFVLTLLVRGLSSPAHIEAWFSRGLFVYYRQAWDWISAAMPFPLIYLLVGWMFLIGMLRLYHWLGSGMSWRSTLVQVAWRSVLLVAMIATLFLWLWGFHYKRVPLEEQLGLEVQELNDTLLKATYFEVTEALEADRRAIPAAQGRAVVEGDLPPDLEAVIRSLMKNFLQHHGFPAAGAVRVRRLEPRGTLLRFSSSGVYLPWVGEGHVDAGLHPAQVPFVLAHEMAHGYGFADEGICNFIAFLVCIRSEDPMIRYSGRLGYWRYLASDFRRNDQEGYVLAAKAQAPEIRLDLEAIYEAQLQYPDLFPRLRFWLYDQFLKVQGVEGGIKSYSRISRLVHAYFVKYPEKQ